jgi:S-formylglutathione hydrolase FrmB
MRVAVIGVVMAVLVSGASASPKSPWDNPPKQRVRGLEHRTFRSASMKAEVGYNICLPPEYRDEKKRFPVIYYLHGYEGNESSYLDYAQYWRESLSEAGPTILVFVNGGETSFFCDSPDSSMMGETVVKELISHVDQTCRTMAQRQGRSLHGYSMGGFGALKLAFKYPDMFGSVVAYGATLSSAEQMKKHLGKIYAKMFGGDKARFDANNPLALLERNANAIRENLRVQLMIGSKDEFLPANRQLHQRLTALRVRATFEEIPGARHKKEAIYEKAALRSFAFTLGREGQPR